MIFFILAAIASVVCFWYAAHDPSLGPGTDWGFSALMGGGTLVIGGLVALLLNVLVGSSLHHTVPAETDQLLSLQDGPSTSGAFFLGIGGFSSSPTYTFYEQTPHGAAHLEQYASDDSINIYQDAKPGQARVAYYTDVTNFWLSIFNDKSDRIDIHVPSGTIKTDYKLDASN